MPARENPLAVITGASSGIGYELAATFARNGYDLIIASDSDKIETACEKLKAFKTQVESIQCDLAEYEGVEQLCRKIALSGRRVDAVAFNAGVGVNGKFTDTSLEEEIRLINLNVVSYVHLAKRVTQEMVMRQEGGKLLFTASVAATAPGPYMAVYNASKAFIFSFAEALRYELKENNITVTALLPGPTETNFFQRAEMQNTKVGQEEKDDPAEVAQQGFAALMEGKDHIIAGSLKTRLQNAANDLIPETTKAGLYAKETKPGTANG